MRKLLPVALVLQFCSLTFAQTKEGTLERLNGKVQSYLDTHPLFYAHAFFNQTQYSPGDTAFFQAWFLTETNQPVKGRALLRLALVNSSGRLAEEIQFRVKDGVGANQLVIPHTISPGKYNLIIYNEWMKNFDILPSFQGEITIVAKKKLSDKKQGPSLQFFPEGGTFVAGVPNKVVIKAAGEVQSVAVENDQNQEITKVSLDHNGLGFVVFTPQKGTTYFASVDGGSERFKFPDTQPDGVSLLLTPNDKGEPVKVLVALPPYSSLSKEVFGVLLVSGNEVRFSASLQFDKKNVGLLSIPQTKLPKGIAQLVLVDAKSQVRAKRCFLVGNNEAATANITLTKSAFHQREKVTLGVELTDELKNNLVGEFSISVVNQKLVDYEYKNKSEAFLTNLLHRSNTDNSNFTVTDNELISSSGFLPWDKILSDGMDTQFPSPTHIYKKGRAFFETNGEPVPDSTFITVYLQKHLMGYEVTTDKNGEFGVAFFFDFYDDDELFFTAENRGRELKNIRIEWFEEEMHFQPSVSTTEVHESSAYGMFKSDEKTIAASYSFFNEPTSSQHAGLQNPNSEFEEEFMGADLSINVVDYVIFPNMEELIREIIPSLQHRRVKGKNTVRVLQTNPPAIPTGDPLYIIDGVMTKNTEFFLSLKPSNILTVKIEKDINKLGRLGSIGKNGIVYVQTKNQDTKQALKDNTMVPIKGLSKPTDFKNPFYFDETNRRIPDFRSTIYWSPSVKTDAFGKAEVTFFTSDDVGPLKIKISGFTTDGRPFSAEADIEVSFDSAQNR